MLAATSCSLQGQTGQQLFESSCAGCHGLDGRGGEHAPNIASSSKTRSLPDSALTHIVHDGIPGSGMPAFGSIFKSGQIDAVVSYLRTLQGIQSSAPVSGDAEAGRALFEGKGGCAQCHSMNGKGGFLAADLSGYGKAHSPDELRQQILTHKGIIRIVTHQGRTYEGVVRNEDNFSLQLQTFNGDFLFVKRTDLLTVEQHGGVKLDESNLDDLISYLSR